MKLRSLFASCTFLGTLLTAFASCSDNDVTVTPPADAAADTSATTTVVCQAGLAACTCANGAAGMQRCFEPDIAFGPCTCDGITADATPNDASPGPRDSGRDASGFDAGGDGSAPPCPAGFICRKFNQGQFCATAQGPVRCDANNACPMLPGAQCVAAMGMPFCVRPCSESSAADASSADAANDSASDAGESDSGDGGDGSTPPDMAQ
jgi:hypothetical protein